jgi:uncharacterized protein (TIGR02271 family)
MQNSFYSQVHEGMEVRDADGNKIGNCGETLGDYFNVDAGFLGMTEYYIPFSAITNVSENDIYLNVRKDEVKSMGWDRRPETSSTSTAATTENRGTRMRSAEATGAAEQTIQLREEQLQARKVATQSGSVELGKEIVEEQRTLEVPVSHEEVYIERHPVDRRVADQPISETETETIRVPVTEEHVEVEKQPVVYEEVGLGKRVTQETQQVSDTVRREELRVDHEGDVNVRNKP